jgi:hypothetical protein
MAAALAADQAIDKELADQRTRLVNAEKASEYHEKRCDGFMESGNRDAYRKERVELDFTSGNRDRIRKKIEALENGRSAAVARAKAECQRRLDEREALEREGAEIQRELKKAEAAIAFLAEFCPREAAYYSKLVHFNGGVSVGIEPIETPEAPLRYMPGIPERKQGTKKVKRTRLRDGAENSSASGPDRYETYEAEEPIIVPAVPAFEPLPLFRRVIVPAFHRDGPHYMPPGVQPSW